MVEEVVSTTWLTPDEVFELTAAKRWGAQCQRLAVMGIPFLPNAVGRPLVERAVVLKSPTPTMPARKKAEPYWGPLEGPQKK